MRFVLIALAMVVMSAALAIAQEDRPRCEKCGMFWDNSPTRLSMEVKAGDKLIIIEAMKMLTTVSAQTDGTIKEILVKKGVQVDSDDLLVVMEE